MANLFDKQQPPMPDEPEPQAEMDMEAQDPNAEQEEDVNLDDPAYQDALAMAQQKLYADGYGKQLGQALQKAPDLPAAMAEQAGLLLKGTDELTGGEVPDELYMMLGMEMLGEVSDIAGSMGLDVSGKVLAKAAQLFIINTTKDLGGDTSQVEQAMSQIPIGDDQPQPMPQGA